MVTRRTGNAGNNPFRRTRQRNYTVRFLSNRRKNPLPQLLPQHRVKDWRFEQSSVIKLVVSFLWVPWRSNAADETEDRGTG